MRLLLSASISFLVLAVAASATGCAAADDPAPDDGVVDSELRTDNAKAAFEYFVGKGLSELQAAAVVGNLQQESGISPTSVQPGGPGRGIAQWSVGARWNVSHNDNLASFSREHSRSLLALTTQLDFIWFELETFSQYGLSALRDATSITEATLVFQRDFEACGTCAQSRRLAYAKVALRTYGHGL